MAEKLLKEVYKTPLAVVRGVFLCEDVAVPVSVLTWDITQEGWGDSYTTLGDDAAEGGEFWLGY
jgi:hypothetical protein